VTVPTYDRSALQVGIVHLGVGGFHRSHQAFYLDALMSRGLAHKQAICGVGVLERDREMRDGLTSQDMLYTLTLAHPDGSRSTQVIGSMIEYLFGPDDPEAVVERMADPQVTIVSMTITAAGYKIDPATGAFQVDDHEVAHDLAGGVPLTVFPYIVQALSTRRSRRIPPFTVMTCDNLPGNGDCARLAVTSFARAGNPELAKWIEDHVSFPNSMVDRITPFTTEADRAELTQRTGIIDACPVVSEPFIQWVLQDRFTDSRPPYERVGVTVVDDPGPYETMKLRMLNSAHQAMCYVALLAGHHYVHEAAADPLVVAFLRAYFAREVEPTMSPVPGLDSTHYGEMVLSRFANSQVKDTLARLGGKSSSAVPTLVFPMVHENLVAGRSVRLATAAIAAWAVFCGMTDEDGLSYTRNDPLEEVLLAAAEASQADPRQFVTVSGLFGDLSTRSEFVELFVNEVTQIRRDGVGALIRSLLDDE
jgi:mannitol 2-dehydrogenase